MKKLKTVLFSTAKSILFFVGGLLIFSICSPLTRRFVPNKYQMAKWWPIAEAAIAAVVVFLYYLAIVLFDHKHGREHTGIAFKNPWHRHYALGVGLGATLITVMWSVLVAIVGVEVQISNLNVSKAIAIAVFIPQMSLAAISQEMIFRGIAAFAGRRAGKIYISLLMSVIFVFAHFAVLTDTFTFELYDFDMPTAISLFLFSLICFELTWITGSLWSAAGFHGAFYTFSRSIYGLSLDGIGDYDGILQSRQTSISDMITGGSKGIFASYLCVIVLAIGFLFLWILYRNPNKSDEPLAGWMLYGEWAVAND